MTSFHIPEVGELLKQTTSRCPICHCPCPAEVWKINGQPSRIFLKRRCPEHGLATNCISSDARFYWLAKGNPQNACACHQNAPSPDPIAFPQPPDMNSQTGMACCAATGQGVGTLGRNATEQGSIEKLSTCLALIEIVHSCNLSCPTCYADSPVGTGAKVNAVPIEDLKARIDGVIRRKGRIEILQLSGGEPTLHPQFFELLEWAQAHRAIDYLLLNTNGVRLAADDAFAERLAKTFRYGKLQLYLQFDGMQAEGQAELRGGDLRSLKQKAIERCGEMNLPATLAMTVTQANLPHLWAAIEFGLRFRHVRGISFQPFFGSGRVPESFKTQSVKARIHEAQATINGEAQRLNVADIILAAVEQSGGQLRFEDFTPLPCGDPNCATIGYLLRINGRTHSVSDFIDFAHVQGFLRDKVRYNLEDLARCGCESEPLGKLLKQFEIDASHTFRLFIKPFMDAWSWDQDRIDRCCTHVIRPDGKLDSFCRYYSGFSDANPGATL